VGLGLDDGRSVARLEQMPNVVVSPVEVVRVPAVQPVHADREVGVRSLNQQMEVIRHQAVGRTQPATLVDDLGQYCEEPAPVDVVEEDGPTLGPARRHVVDRVRRLEARAARHRSKVAAAQRTNGPQV
jgi:hypothetical protein